MTGALSWCVAGLFLQGFQVFLKGKSLRRSLSHLAVWGMPPPQEIFGVLDAEICNFGRFCYVSAVQSPPSPQAL